MVKLCVCECVRQTEGPRLWGSGDPSAGEGTGLQLAPACDLTRPPLPSSCCSSPLYPFRPFEIKREKKAKKLKNINEKNLYIYRNQ